MAHHLDILEAVGLIERSRSSGDGRRRYVHLRPHRLDTLRRLPTMTARSALFVCSAISARSQLAAARRAGLDLSTAVPRSLLDVRRRPALTNTVCDRAHEALEPAADRLHWSIPDPVAAGPAGEFDDTVVELRRRITDKVGVA